MDKLHFLIFLNRIKCLKAGNSDKKCCPFIHSLTSKLFEVIVMAVFIAYQDELIIEQSSK